MEIYRWDTESHVLIVVTPRAGSKNVGPAGLTGLNCEGPMSENGNHRPSHRQSGFLQRA